MKEHIKKDNWKNSKSGSNMFHYFLSVSLIASVVVMITIGSTLYSAIHNYVLCEAERDAKEVDEIKHEVDMLSKMCTETDRTQEQQDNNKVNNHIDSKNS